MKTSNTIIGLWAVALVCCFDSCSGNKHQKSGADVMSVDVAYPETDSLTLYKDYPGTMSANDEVALMARVSGILESTPYNSGAPVRKGQILFTIEDTKYRDALRQAEANLATAYSTRDYAKSNCEAMKKALESDAVSQIDVLQAEASLRQAEASIKNAEAALQTARTNLEYCVIRAPFDGRITSRALDPHTYIDGEASPVELAKIYQDDMMVASFYIEDRQFMRLFPSGLNTPGLNLNVVPLKFAEKLPHEYNARITYFAPNVDSGTGTVKVQGQVENPYGELISGMYVTIRLPYANDSDAVLVKDASIGQDQRGRYLYTVNDSNKIAYTSVSVGALVNDTMRIITSGIEPGTAYVTKALLKVRTGEIIHPVVVK